MKRTAGYLLAAILSCHSGTGVAMSIEQMQRLPGANLLGLRVADVLASCGLPTAIADPRPGTSATRDVTWQDTTMKLSEGNWELRYGRSRVAVPDGTFNGWANPAPGNSPCLDDFTKITLTALGGVGILTIDKIRHKTSYTVPRDLLQAHKVIAYETSLENPVPVADMVKAYGRDYESLPLDEQHRILRYWVEVESSQMPIELYAVDFVVSNRDDTYGSMRVASSEIGFVRAKLRERTEMWEKFGID